LATLQVRVIPRAGRTAVAGRRGESVLIRLAAAPVDGAANEALIDLLSDTFGVPRRRITIASGQRTRDKRVEIDGIDDAAIAARLSAADKRGTGG
jgi:uncharacterized protein (TIGR00251 family)